MKTLIFGATGPTGRQVLSCALKRGHAVTVLVRDPDALSEIGIEVFRGGMNTSSVMALHGSSAASYGRRSPSAYRVSDSLCGTHGAR